MTTYCSRSRIAAFLIVLVALASCRGAENQESLIGPWDVQRPSGVPRSTLEFRLVLDAAEPGSIELPDPDADGKVLALSPRTVATQSDIAKTAVVQSATPEYFGVYVYFTPEAARRMREVSRDNVGHRLAIVMNGQIFMAPYMQAMFDSPVLIQSSYTREQATHLAERLAP